MSTVVALQPRIGIHVEFLKSMIMELAFHFERYGTTANDDFDWVSPSGRTRVECVARSADLHSVLHQDPDSILASYRLYFDGVSVFCAQEYRWPHLRQALYASSIESSVFVPTASLDEVLAYHADKRTLWSTRNRLSSAVPFSTKIGEVGIMTELDGF